MPHINFYRENLSKNSHATGQGKDPQISAPGAKLLNELNAQDGSKASPLCFGCMQFGGTADAAASQAMFEGRRGAAINFFDTAHT